MNKVMLVIAVVGLALFSAGCRSQNYDPVETMVVEEARVKVYFPANIHSPMYDWFGERTPDPQKHRSVEFVVTLRNNGDRLKDYVIVEPILPSSLTKLVINQCEGLTGAVAPGSTYSPGRLLQYLTEGDPKEIETLAAQSKIRIVWVEQKKKWEKTVPVTLAE